MGTANESISELTARHAAFRAIRNETRLWRASEPSVVMDTPDFLAWATAQDGFAAQAEKFARDNDLDW